MMQFCINPYTDGKDVLETMQYRILLNSYLYYELNENIITDGEFDRECKQYLNFVEHFGAEVLKQTKFYNAFAGFDGTTGFDLCSKVNKCELEKIKRRAIVQLRLKQ